MLQKSCKRTDKLLVDPVLSPCPIYELTHCASSGKRMLSSTDNRRLEPFSKETFSFVYLYNYCTSMLPDGNHQGPNIALRRRVAKAEEFKPRPVFRSSLHWQTLSLWYCGWKKSCTSWYMFFFSGIQPSFWWCRISSIHGMIGSGWEMSPCEDAGLFICVQGMPFFKLQYIIYIIFRKKWKIILDIWYLYWY